MRALRFAAQACIALAAFTALTSTPRDAGAQAPAPVAATDAATARIARQCNLFARDDWRAILDVRVSADYTLRAIYRNLVYTEDAYDAYDAYDAKILELAVGVSW